MLRSIDMLPDPRVEKYVDFYRQKNIPYTLLGWNRSEKVQEKENTTYFHRPAAFGAGVGNARALVSFNSFLFKTLRKTRKQYSTIHACDLDTVMPALAMKLLYRKRVVFDIFDWYSHSRNIDSRLFRMLIGFCEWFAVKFADAIVLCDSERRGQIPWRVPDRKLMVLPNVPAYTETPPRKKLREAGYDLLLAYVGIFGTSRGLEDLVAVVSEMPRVRLTIAGFGELQPLVEENAGKAPNISFVGKADYKTGLQIMADADLICAMYYKDIPNHIYAAPNKFYEGLYLGNPILTTIGTIPGTKCEKEKIGFAIDEGRDAIRDFLLQINPQEIEMRGRNAKQLWENKYKTMWQDTIETKYWNAI